MYGNTSIYEGPYPNVTLRMPFLDDVVGDFVYHCHILQHEDSGMMATIRVVPPSPPPSIGGASNSTTPAAASPTPSAGGTPTPAGTGSPGAGSKPPPPSINSRLAVGIVIIIVLTLAAAWLGRDMLTNDARGGGAGRGAEEAGYAALATPRPFRQAGGSPRGGGDGGASPFGAGGAAAGVGPRPPPPPERPHPGGGSPAQLPPSQPMRVRLAWKIENAFF